LHPYLDDLPNLYFLYTYIGIQVVLGFLMGLGSLVAGWWLLLTLDIYIRILAYVFSFLLRLSLSILVLCCLTPVSLSAAAVVHLAKYMYKTERDKEKVEQVEQVEQVEKTDQVN